MKKTIALILTIAMVAALLTGCAGTTVVYTDCTCDGVHVSTESTETTGATETTVAVEGSVKTGLAVVASVTTTDAAADAAGKISYDVSLVAVLVDDEGIIVDCVIDSLGTEVSFDATGAITGGFSAEVLTKNELGFDYNMELYTQGAAVGEWFEQAASFCAYVTGKTPAEVAGIAVDESSVPTEVDLVTSVTIKIGGFQALIAKAAQ